MPNWAWRAGRLLAALAFFIVADAGAQDVLLTLANVDHPLFSARDVRLSAGSLGAGGAELAIGSLRIGARQWSQVVLRCPVLRWTAREVSCPRGELRLPKLDALPLRFAYVAAQRRLEVVLQPNALERLQLTMELQRDARQVVAQFDNVRLDRLAALLPQLAAYKAAGIAEGTVRWSARGERASLAARLRLSQLSFNNPAGTQAGDKIAAKVVLDAEQTATRWQWRSALDWESGEAYVQPFYIAQGGVRVTAEGVLDGKRLSVANGRAEIADVGRAGFEVSVDLEAMAMRSFSVQTDEVDLKRVAPVLIAPLLAQRGLPHHDFDGRAQLSARVESGLLQALHVRLADASLAEGRGRFAARSISGDIPWRRDAPTQGNLSIGGGSFGRIPLGAFVLPIAMNGFSVALPGVRIPVLDSELVLDGVQAEKRGDQWNWRVGGALHPVSMARLTAALGLPRMSGLLSASIPTVSHSESTIRLDGTLIIQVFDGYLAASDLRIIEPFGRVPRVHADVEMRNINLGQLTETFSFGSMTGFIDGYLKDLELAGWRPQHVDALVISSPGEYPKRISQRAVQNISALGGAGAAAAIQRSVLRFFEEFCYSKLGVSCVLREGICQMGGIEEDRSGYVIVKGGGIPAINILGYNRRVDWNELVTRLARITESNVKPVIK